MALSQATIPQTGFESEEDIEGANAKNLKVTMVIIYFKNAFDSVHRGLLMKILKAYGIPEILLVELISEMYTGTMAKFVTADGMTKAFAILAGDWSTTIWRHTCSIPVHNFH